MSSWLSLGASTSFTLAADPRQRSHFRVRVPWDSWPYFTLSDSILPFPSPTTRRATVEIFDPATTPHNISPGTDRTENVSSIIVCSLFARETSTELFLSNSCSTVAWLHSCYLVVGLHVVIFSSFWPFEPDGSRNHLCCRGFFSLCTDSEYNSVDYVSHSQDLVCYRVDTLCPELLTCDFICDYLTLGINTIVWRMYDLIFPQWWLCHCVDIYTYCR
jgi:hypothetical protein